MRRKTGIILVGLLTVALLVAGYFILKEKKIVVIDPWLAIPSDAVFIVETPDFPELLTKTTDHNGLMIRLSTMKWADMIESAAESIDSITGSRELRELISGRKVLISFHNVGQNKIIPLAVMNTGPSANIRHLAQLLNRSGATTNVFKELGGVKSLSATYGKGKEKVTIHVALTSGIAVISPSESLVANALNNRNTGSDIRNQQGFSSVTSASGEEMENLFVLFRNLPKFLQSFIIPKEISGISSLAIAAGGDVLYRDDGVFISGFLSTAGAGVGVDKIIDIAPAEPGIHEVLPKGTLSFRTIMNRPAITGEASNDAASINATDLALALSPYTGAEVTKATLPFNAETTAAVFFRMSDRQTAEMVLKEKLSAKYRSMGLGEKHFTSTSKNEKDETIIIYKMPFTGVASMLSGESSESGDDKWVTFCRSYMIFADRPEILINIRLHSDNDNTLINDSDFREMSKSLPTKGSLFFFIAGSSIGRMLSDYLTPAASATVNSVSFSGFDGIGLCLSPSNDMIYTSISFRYSDGNEGDATGFSAEPSGPSSGSAIIEGEESQLLWKTKLKAELAMKPFFFTNHNTGATEIFVQDKLYNIYLLNSAGKILWEAPVREQIRGDVFMVDYYKNGKNQLLFTGKDYIHMIDRNGNYVDKYPVKLKSPASNSLGLFDYEGNKEYRLCISGDDRKIYMYDRSGTPVKGWNQFTTKGKTEGQVTFFRVKGKDYLVTADDQAVYLLDRTGNIRVNIKEPVSKAKGSSIRLQPGVEPSLVFTTTDGTIINVKFDGSVSRTSLKGFSAHHSFDSFDLDSDGKNEYIYIDEGTLFVYNNDGEEIFTKTFETTSIKGPYRFIFSASDRKLGLWEESKQMIYLINRNGTITNGFPRNGGGLFSAGKLSTKSRWSFIFGGVDGYLYNYELNAGI